MLKVKFECSPGSKNYIKNIDNKLVIKYLQGPGSIGRHLKYSFKECKTNNADLYITWKIDDEMNDDLIGYSAAYLNSRPGIIYLNSQNWHSIREPHHNEWVRQYGNKKSTLTKYRKYMVNHEFGHVCGLDHDDFIKKPKCNLMEKQTFTPKRLCKPSIYLHKKTIKKLKNNVQRLRF
tara:strand:- start:8069 stop:8599 length:531 start_codon:yes stop_codon:yes gene_type:complete